MSNPPPPSEPALPSVGDISVCHQYTMAATVAASTPAGAVGAAECLTQAGAVGAADSAAVGAADAAVVTALSADAAKDGDKKRKAASSPVMAIVAPTKMPPCATKGIASEDGMFLWFVQQCEVICSYKLMNS